MTHWNVKIYDDRREHETVRGLTYTQANTIMAALDRMGVRGKAMEYDDEGKFTGESYSVNSPF